MGEAKKKWPSKLNIVSVPDDIRRDIARAVRSVTLIASGCECAAINVLGALKGLPQDLLFKFMRSKLDALEIRKRLMAAQYKNDPGRSGSSDARSA